MDWISVWCFLGIFMTGCGMVTATHFVWYRQPRWMYGVWFLLVTWGSWYVTRAIREAAMNVGLQQDAHSVKKLGLSGACFCANRRSPP